MAADTFHILVFSAHLFMKKSSWGFYVSVFDSSGETAALPRSSDSCVPGGSGTQNEVERTTSCEEGSDVIMKSPMDHESFMSWFRFCVRRVWVNWNEDTSSAAPGWFLNSVVFVLDHFSADPVFTTINTTARHLFTFCRCICAEERAQILDPIVTS